MQKTKLSFFEQIRYAITKPMQYYRLTRTSGGRLTGFVFLFVLFTSLFTILPMFYAAIGPNGFMQYLREDLPAFDMTNGELSVDGRYEQDNGNTYVLVDTSVQEYTSTDIREYYDQVILVSKTNIVEYQFGRIQTINFSDLRGFHFDNGIITALMPFLYFILVFVAIFIYAFFAGAYFFTALLYSVIGMIVAAIAHAEMKFALLFKTAIYGKVTASILVAIVSIIPLPIPGFIIKGIAIIITCTYVVYGTLSHNSEEAKAAMKALSYPQNGPYSDGSYPPNNNYYDPNNNYNGFPDNNQKPGDDQNGDNWNHPSEH
jgi:Protein of unknown function (DUF1189).